jgi:hypothetical protein
MKAETEEVARPTTRRKTNRQLARLWQEQLKPRYVRH